MSIENPFDKPPASSQPERELTPDELREKLRDPYFLPTHDDIARAFKKEGHFSESWCDFCFDKENPVFEFLNEEFITAFSQYLSERVEGLGASEDSPITILEVGAGNGRLSHFLQQKLEAKLPGKVKVIATDSREWSLKTAFPVETIGHNEALEKHKPKMVVFSWMPYQEDVTDDFRAADSVEEYILIGETDGGCCGDKWRTWGQPWSFDEEDGGEEKVAPYTADGFKRENIKDVSDHQICRTDEPGDYRYSSTTSFRRER